MILKDFKTLEQIVKDIKQNKKAVSNQTNQEGASNPEL
jgi:hypothetical protein